MEGFTPSIPGYEILGELGFDARAIASLRKNGAIPEAERKAA